MARNQSELQVITFAKNLLSYVFTVTKNSPKQFRFTFVGRLQNYVCDIVEELYYANDIYVTPTSPAGWTERLSHQRKAMSRLKLLTYFSQTAMEQGAIQPKQFEQISQQVYNTENLLGAWMISDQKRMNNGIKPKPPQG